MENRTNGTPFAGSFEAFADVSAAVESGAGMPEVARATNRALGASVAVIDGASRVLAVACASPDDERAVLSGREGTEVHELRVADIVVGQLRFRSRATPPPHALVRMVGALIALELERSRGPERAAEAAVSEFLGDLLGRRLSARDAIVARGRELGCDLAAGASVIVMHARPHQAQEGDWRARVLTLIERGLRPVDSTSIAARVLLGQRSEGEAPVAPGGEALVAVVPGTDSGVADRAAAAVRRELEHGLTGYGIAVGRSRPTRDPADLYRAGAEALLAANLAESQGQEGLAFEQTGAYRLLLPAMSEDPAELQRFHDETVAPLVAYDEQYQTELVHTLESFLEADGNVARTAQKLYTHRHTIRYRLERVRELTGFDVGSSDGRERLGLGLKAMRVLGILRPGGSGDERGRPR